MDMNMSGSADSDYSDFEFQQIQMKVGAEEADGSQSQTTFQAYGVSPLSDIGGLANNEVAELVAYRVTAAVDGNDSASVGDQNAGGSFHFEASVGANAADEGAVPEAFDVVESDFGGAPSSLKSASRDEIFELIQGTYSLPFDDETNSLGGGQNSTLYSESRNFRDLTGRGPVLDTSDNLTIAAIITANDSVIPVDLVIHLHCIWDLAETSDAGRAFSVPSDD